MADHSDSPLSSRLLAEIDEIDRDLVRQIANRQALVQQLADSSPADAPVGRVAKAAARIEQIVATEKATSSVAGALRHISSICLQNVKTLRVSYLGPEHSYSHLAALKYFGDAVEFASVASIPAVFDAVNEGHATTGLVPIENSTDGRIVDTLGMFVRQQMQICGEVLLPIHHNLLSKTPRNEITQVHSKPQALSQCREWLSKNLPGATIHEASSTTGAAKLAATTPGVAAVASLQAGQQYGLDVIDASIEDNSNNITRFAVLGREEPDATGDDKTSLLFQVNHQPGALADVMAVFKDQKLNLTWIESFPCPDSHNEYLFFVELTGHRSEQSVAKTIEILDSSTQRLDVLGSYPRAH